LVEGIVAFLIGLYIVLQPAQATGILIRLIGGFVLFESVMAVIRLVSGKAEPAAPGRWIRVGVGLVVGIVAFGYPWMAAMTVGAAATVLAIGLIVIGGLGIYQIFVTHSVAGWRWGQMIIYIIYVLLAILVFYQNISGNQLGILPMIGWVTLIGGVALTGYGIWLYQKVASAKAASDAAAVLANAPSATDAPVTSASVSAPTPTDSVPSAAAPTAASAGPNSAASSDGNGSAPASISGS
jgi:uncharacterized membrane protein HdeD (DUF308 family)